ncbi:chemotaxis protein CheW [Bosea sp. TND4EK4]|uniref:chemotaxis protein CheW n=1 Tax=Bosea sp. TND4EK4 TaxID=1907408 RepID=UPI00095657A2|nr:chemotaxis protein CheW [Bosea sp. TND4EK4]SIQ05856.1 Chemotaxis signal transduction protein [Bosea sp. TND4EK4]
MLDIIGPEERRLAQLIRHMRSVDDYRQTFDRLQASWDTLTLLGQLSGGATEMEGTRTAFSRLTTELLGHLAVATRDKVVAELRTKAQNAIDLLVRNLFERTADIGFLAADTDIREFLEQGTEDGAARARIEARFRDYVAKYSVYADIVLVDGAGTVKARLTEHPSGQILHPVIGEALNSAGAYVEHYGPADFVSETNELLYAWRVEGQAGRPLGVLVLVFRLADEMAGIFRKLLPEADWTVLGCVTPEGRVVAGSCPLQMPRGLRVATADLRGRAPILRLGGRRYLAVACRPAPYQGYAGPGWLGLGLVPLEAAFDAEDGPAAEMDEQVLGAVTSRSELFPPALKTVSRQAAAIQSNLNRAVWNGSIRQAGSAHANAAFSKILLWEISDAGRKTQEACDASIRELHRTVVAAMLGKCRSRAALAIDVMDRNLYERANDCRWWALNATFARALASPSREMAQLCGKTLATINALYTVYTNLILFDAQGMVVAVSQPDQSGWIGVTLKEEWVARTLALRSGQHYVVSGFEPSPLYGEAATLIYAAAVQDEAGRAIGGIAIVFDATPQFAAILNDCLPADDSGQPLPGGFALLVGRDGRVLSSTEPGFAVGAASPFAIDPAALARDGDMATIRRIGGRFFAIGAAFSKGYREYRTSDGHQPDAMAICAVPLGEAAAAAQPRVMRGGGAAGHAQPALRRPEGAVTFEAATFDIGRHWLGVGAGQVVEAVDFADLKPSARRAPDGLLAGYKLHEGEPVPVLRLDRMLGFEAGEAEERQIVIVKAAGRTFGLVVDALGPIPEIAENEIQPLREMGGRFDVPARGLVASDSVAGGARGMLLLLDAERLGVRLETEARALVHAAE